MIFKIILDDNINEETIFDDKSLDIHFKKHVLLNHETADIDVNGIPYKNPDGTGYLQRVFNRIQKSEYKEKAITLANSLAREVISTYNSTLEPNTVYI